MSGGHFEYNQYHMEEIADEIDRVVATNKDESVDECGDTVGRFYSDAVIDRIRRASLQLRKLRRMVHAIDYLLSGDTGEESFMKEWNENEMEYPDANANVPAFNAHNLLKAVDECDDVKYQKVTLTIGTVDGLIGRSVEVKWSDGSITRGDLLCVDRVMRMFGVMMVDSEGVAIKYVWINVDNVLYISKSDEEVMTNKTTEPAQNP